MVLCWPIGKTQTKVREIKHENVQFECKLCEENINLTCKGHLKSQICEEKLKENNLKLVHRQDSNPESPEAKPIYYTFKLLNSLTSKRIWMIAPSLRATYLSLDLHKKKLEKIPENIHRFKDLKAIRVDENFRLKTLSNLKEISKLRIIIAKNCNIESIEDALPIRLLALELYNNPKLKEFGSLQNLRRLQFLNIGRCGITQIPIQVSKLQNLRVLSLENSQRLIQPITGLAAITQLQILLVKNCNLTNIPEEVFSLKELLYLSVEQNRINEIGSNIICMENLTVLSIYGNRGIFVHEKVSRLPYLKRINVDLTFSTKLVSTKLKKFVKIWKDSPSAWWKQL